MDDPLVQDAAHEIHRLLRGVESLDNRGRRRDPRHSKPWRQRLRERAQVNDTAAAIICLQRTRLPRARYVLEIDLAVRIVLDDQDVAPLGPFEQTCTLVEAEKNAGRILKIRHEIQQIDASSGGALPNA